MLTEAFYSTLAALLKGEGPAPGDWTLAVGAGDPAWDRHPPVPDRRRTTLARELARKAVAPADVEFIDDSGAASEVPSARLRLRVRFETEEATGTLREVGLFAGTGAGVLLSYFVHAPIEKTADMSLERVIALDLTPRTGGGTQPTRFLGNSRTREVHDLENLTPTCQVNEIPLDRRVFFVTEEQATGVGYDFCAYCFGRGRSTR